VSQVEKGSLADRLGIQPEDRLVSVNGHVLRDIIDYHFYAAEERLEIEIERAGDQLALVVDRDYGEELGLEFTEDVFDGIRRCSNRCEFCFVDQMPPGLRPSLFVKDDDYRYSFLHGNFITLSNWTKEDWERVGEQRLSPLYVSVHATDHEVRQRLLCNSRVPDVLEQLRRLGEMGIEVHTQVVLVPGLNDGEHLGRTIEDLTALYPTVGSIGVVPVGLTKYHQAGLRLLSDEEVVAALGQVLPRQRKNRERLGVGLVYPSDELYLRAGYPVPPAEEYDGFPQLENGVGLVREFLDDWEEFKRSDPRRLRGSGTLVCGTLIAPLMGEMIADLNDKWGVDIRVAAVKNDFFGMTATVSGLLTGVDISRALKGRDLGEVVLLPRAMFGASGRVTLDEATSEEVGESLGVGVVPASSMEQVVRWFDGGACPPRSWVV
jgi:putative radical SAM enzyme (TIGR03279 family)